MVEIHVRIERQALYELRTDQMEALCEAPQFVGILAGGNGELTLLFHDRQRETEQAARTTREQIESLGLRPLELVARAR